MGVLGLVEIVSVELPDPLGVSVTLVGEKLGVGLLLTLGSTLAVSVTVPEKPLTPARKERRPRAYARLQRSQRCGSRRRRSARRYPHTRGTIVRMNTDASFPLSRYE